MFLFICFQRKSTEQFLKKVPSILVLACIIGVMYLPMSLGTSTVAVVILWSHRFFEKGTTAYKFLTSPKVVYIGLISYSLYYGTGAFFQLVDGLLVLLVVDSLPNRTYVWSCYRFISKN